MLVSHLSIDVRVGLVNIADATVLYVMSGISTGYNIVLIGFFAGEQYVPVREVDFNTQQETEILININLTPNNRNTTSDRIMT